MSKNNFSGIKHLITCEVCGKQVEKKNRQQTCSMECRSELRRRKLLEKATTGECPVCHEVKPLIYKAHEYQVCSDRCRHTLLVRYYHQHYGRGSDWYEKNLDRKKLERVAPPKQKLCLVCNAPLTGLKRRFCSDNCKHRYCDRNAPNQKGTAVAKRNQRLDIESSGACALCGMSFAAILTPESLGFNNFSRYARRTKYHVDHIVPTTSGGTDEPENLRIVCWMCNHIKGTLGPQYDEAVKAASIAFWKTVLT